MLDQLVDRIEHRVERVAIAGEDHPGGERAGAFLAERVEGAVDDLDRIALAGAGALHRFLDARDDPAGDHRGERGLQPGGRAEMVEQIGVGLADLRRHRLQGHRLRPVLDQQPARRLERGGAALFRGQAFAWDGAIDISVNIWSWQSCRIDSARLCIESSGKDEGSAVANTPEDLTITPRDRRFGRGTTQARWWLGGDPVATAFYNALSATFPKGEAFFVESVRAFRDEAPPRLAQEISAFTTQEVMHSREHVAFNKRALEAGYDLSGLEARVEWRLGLTRQRPPIVNLAATMCLEHFTAILAHQLLQNPRHLARCRHGERRPLALARDRGDRA